MMDPCKKCGVELPEGANFCPFCGRAVAPKRGGTKKRGNGQGSVYQLPSGKWRAVVTLGYYLDESGKRHRQCRIRHFDKKKDAVASLGTLATLPAKEEKQKVIFKELYDLWLPTHRAGKQTLDCYKAAIKHFRAVWGVRVRDLDVDDLQECIDDCPAGKRTRENMRATVGLMYKYGIPRRMIPDNLNLAPFLAVSGDGAAHRDSFTDTQIEAIRRGVGRVPYADAVYTMIYTGFRPSEFLELSGASYDEASQTLTGGAKTEAGRGRVVTLSPKVRALVAARALSGGPLWPDPQGNPWASLKSFTELAFYPALEGCGIENPLVEVAGGVKRHKYTPHSCRHTFATLMKRAPGAEKDKLEMMGHTSGEMLRYYQDVSLADLRAITDAL